MWSEEERKRRRVRKEEEVFGDGVVFFRALFGNPLCVSTQPSGDRKVGQPMGKSEICGGKMGDRQVYQIEKMAFYRKMFRFKMKKSGCCERMVVERWRRTLAYEMLSKPERFTLRVFNHGSVTNVRTSVLDKLRSVLYAPVGDGCDESSGVNVRRYAR